MSSPARAAAGKRSTDASMHAGDNELLQLAAAVVTIRERARRQQLAGHASLPSSPSLEATPPLDVGMSTPPARLALPSISLPQLQGERRQSAIELCAKLAAGGGLLWPQQAASHIQAAVSELGAASMHANLHMDSTLLGVADTAIGCLMAELDHTQPMREVLARRMGCQQIVECCAMHSRLADRVSEMLVRSLTLVLTRAESAILHASGTRLIGDASLMACAHVFGALESALVSRGLPASSAQPDWIRELVALEQRARNSPAQLRARYPLLTSSLTHCAWVALEGNAPA